MQTFSVKSAIYIAVLAPLAFAQPSAVIDWQARKFVSGQDIVVNKPLSVQVTVTNVNDILYNYEIKFQTSRKITDDFANIASTPLGAAGLDCDKVKETLTNQSQKIGRAYQDLMTVPVDHQANGRPVYKSISLSETVPKLKTVVDLIAPYKSVLNEARMSCPKETTIYLASAEFAAFEPVMKDIEAKNQLTHVVTGTASVGPDQNLDVIIHEAYKGSPTTAEDLRLSFNTTSDLLTLSAGGLFTRLEQRSYVSRFNGQQNALSVNGLSTIRPLLVAQLNYALPRLNSDTVGLAISSGPTVKLGSADSNVSTVGFFAGLSLYFWHRLFITPGFHIGEFADFPPGLVAGQTIPDKYSDLSPVKRWSTRFAFSITYRTLSFSSLLKKGTGAAEQPKPEPKPK